MGGQGRPVSFFVFGSRRRKLVVLSACWLAEGVLCAIFLRGDPRLAVPAIEPIHESVAPASPANGTGAFSARRLDAGAGYQPAFFLGWKNMRADNGRLGIFKTPLHKTIRIDGLQVRFYQHVQGAAEGVVSASLPAASDMPGPQDSDVNREKSVVQATFIEVFDALRYEFQQKTKTRGMTMGGPLPVDISNVTKVVINGLDCRLVCRDQRELSIECRNAVASASESEIVLRGGVIIRAEGRVLMSNHVLWDMEKSLFSVPGTYVLDHNGVPVRGSGIRCDLHLQPVATPEVYSKKGVEKWTGDSSF